MKKAEQTTSTVTKADVEYALRLSIENKGINPVALKSVQKMGNRYRIVLSSYFTISDAKLIVDEMNTMMKTSFSISPDSWQKMGNGNKSFEMTETKMGTGGGIKHSYEITEEDNEFIVEFYKSDGELDWGRGGFTSREEAEKYALENRRYAKGGALKTSSGEYSWFFNWNEGGFNEVYAKTKAEAIKKATELGYPSYMPENQYALERSLQDVKDKYGQKAVDYIMNKVHSEGEWSNKLQKKLYPKLTLESKGFSQGLTPKLSSFRKQSEEDSRQTTRMANMMSMQKGGGVDDKMTFKEFSETLRDNDKINSYTGKTTTGMEMYYLPTGHPHLGKKFAHKNKRKAYEEYLSSITKTTMETGGGIPDYEVKNVEFAVRKSIIESGFVPFLLNKIQKTGNTYRITVGLEITVANARKIVSNMKNFIKTSSFTFTESSFKKLKNGKIVFDITEKKKTTSNKEDKPLVIKFLEGEGEYNRCVRLVTDLYKDDKDMALDRLTDTLYDIDPVHQVNILGDDKSSHAQIAYDYIMKHNSSSKMGTGGGVNSTDTKKIIESISEIRYDLLPPVNERNMSKRAYEKILLDATKKAIKDLYSYEYYDIHDIQKATREAGGVYNKAFVDLYGEKLTYAKGGNIESYVVISKAPDGYLVVMSKPVSSKSEAEKLAKLTTAPKGEVISVMTTESVRSSKKVLGREYLADGGKMAFGGMVYDLSEGAIDRMEGLYPNEEMSTFLHVANLIIEDMENEGFEKDEIISFLAHKMVERSRMQDTSMATGGGVSGNDQYCVVMAGGSIGERNGVFDRAMNKLVATFDMPDAEGKAREYAKRMNATLSPGEKKYYKIKYSAKKYDATKFSPREMKATGGNVESGAAHLYITLDKGDIKVYHGDDRKTVLLEKPQVSEGSWNKLWNCLRGL